MEWDLCNNNDEPKINLCPEIIISTVDLQDIFFKKTTQQHVQCLESIG